jgi:uncharacterized protein YceK
MVFLDFATGASISGRRTMMSHAANRRGCSPARSGGPTMKAQMHPGSLSRGKTSLPLLSLPEIIEFDPTTTVSEQ